MSLWSGLFGFVRVLLAVGRECAGEEGAASRVAAVLVDLPLLERGELLAGGAHDVVRRADIQRVAAHILATRTIVSNIPS